MSLTLNIKGGPATAVAKSGLDQLKESGAEDAKGILANLRGEFEGKTGVVRLMHTSKADRNMKFSDAGGFKQIFISGSKLETTGRVIAQLMEGSGDFTPSEIKAFKDYASDRGERGIESRQLAAYLTPLKQATYATSEEALQALGVTGHEGSGRDLGEGTQGSVRKVMMNGQPFALKTFKVPETIKVAGPNGKPIEPEPEDETRSWESVSLGPYQNKNGLLPFEKNQAGSGFDNQNVEHRKNSYLRGTDSSEESKESKAEFPKFDGGMQDFIFKQMVKKKDQPIVSEDKLEGSSENWDHKSSNYSSSNDSQLDEAVASFRPYKQESKNDFLNIDRNLVGQKYQSQSEVSDDEPEAPSLPEYVQNKLRLLENPLEQPELHRQAPVNPEPASSDSAKTESKLARTLGIGSVARMRHLDQVVQPSHYLVTETANGRVHVVEGGRALKDWAKSKAPGTDFQVTQYLMPLAAGKELMTFKEGRAAESLNFKREDLPAIARSMKSLLEKMWKNGFVDGDIKPANLMWDPSSKTLRAIDIDSFQKVSKKDGSAMPKSGVLTYAYAHPYLLSPNKEKAPTLGRDLFSAGMVILEAALRSRGLGVEADGIMRLYEPDKKLIYLRLTENLPERLDRMKESLNFADGGVEDFAMLCLKTSLDYEKRRFDQGIKRFERYDENAGNDHPMSILNRHPLMRQVQ